MAKKRSVFYHIRRKGQALVYRLTSPEFVSNIYFRIEVGYKPDLKTPKTLNEKLQWLKLYYCPRMRERYNARINTESGII